MKIEVLLKKLEKNPSINKAKELASTYVEGTDLAGLRKELKRYLTLKKQTDKSKIDIGFDVGFKNPNADMEKLNNKMIRNQAFQDRVVEIHIILDKIYKRLDFIFDNAKGTIYLEYDGLLSNMTKEAKEYLVKKLFEKEREFYADLESVLEDADILLKNLYNTGWMLQNLKEAGEGIITRRGTYK